MISGMAKRDFLVLATILTICAVSVWGCDSSISGSDNENSAPDTELSIRDESLVDNLGEDARLISTVRVSWSGTDSDGFIAFYEVRAFDLAERAGLGPEDRWITTTSLDTLILLPIPFGQSTAEVVFEVRATDNEGLTDPSPASTVFPIKNSPPTITISSFDVPPENTFSVFSFGWNARDPDGDANLKNIEVSLNDSTNFSPLPPDTRFVTLVGQVDENTPEQAIVDARAYVGRGFDRTDVFVPGLRLDDVNTFYVRAVDVTDTTSTVEQFEWKVQRPHGDVLIVNDYRKTFALSLQGFHEQLLRDYLPDDVDIDVFDISEPWLSGSTANSVLSTGLPSSATPTLAQTLLLFKYIYWFSTNVTTTAIGNNLAFAAPALNVFFENGGKMIIHVPIQVPNDPEEFETNPAIALLPITQVVSFPDSIRTFLRLRNSAAVTAVGQLPGVSEPLPDLVANRPIILTLPYIVGGNTIPLYEAEYDQILRQGSVRQPWPGSSVVASMTSDRRVALISFPIANELDNSIQFDGADGSSDAAIKAVHLILESLGFPKR